MLFGTGVAACYDLDGNRVWAAVIEKPAHSWGHSSSPLLLGDRLIVHVRNVYGLDTATGKIVWKQESKPRWGSLVRLAIGDADYAVTANGEIFDPVKGAKLATGLAPLAFCAPLLAGKELYMIQNGGKAFRIPEGLSAENKPEELWATSPKKDRYYASPLYHDGLIYAATRGRQMSVIDAKNGEIVYTMKLPCKGTVYPSFVQLGDKICVSSDDGTSIVFEPGREYKEVSINKLEKFRSSPLIADNRVYIRTMKHLYCIGK